MKAIATERYTMSSGVPTTTMTSLPMLRRSETENVSYYAYNLSTSTVYVAFRGCGINTANTGMWVTLVATATVPASAATCLQSYSVSALQSPVNYLTVEYAALATGGVSALTQILSVW